MIKTHPEVKTLVVLVHGVRSTNAWGSFIRELIYKKLGNETVHVAMIDYGKKWATVCLANKELFIDYISSRLTVLSFKYPNAELNVVAHSFGTLAVCEAVSRYRIKLGSVFLFGSIVRENFEWNTLIEEGTVRNVWNFFSPKDWVVRFLAPLVFLGRSGSFPFKQIGRNRVLNLERRWGHSKFMKGLTEVVSFLKKVYTREA